MKFNLKIEIKDDKFDALLYFPYLRKMIFEKPI